MSSWVRTFGFPEDQAIDARLTKKPADSASSWSASKNPGSAQFLIKPPAANWRIGEFLSTSQSRVALVSTIDAVASTLKPRRWQPAMAMSLARSHRVAPRTERNVHRRWVAQVERNERLLVGQATWARRAQRRRHSRTRRWRRRPGVDRVPIISAPRGQS